MLWKINLKTLLKIFCIIILIFFVCIIFKQIAIASTLFTDGVNTSAATGGYFIDNNLILQASTTNYGTFIGELAGKNILADGLKNTFVGYQAGYKAESTDNNTFIGYKAGESTEDGWFNTAIGAEAFALNTAGFDTVAVGVNALYKNTTGAHNTAVGMGSMMENTTGIHNVAVGKGSALNNTTGNKNTAIGRNASRFNIAGNSNVAVGYESLYLNSSSNSNTAVGYQAGYGARGNENRNNSLFGYQAGYRLTTGSNNILLGYRAGDNLTTGGANIILGYNIDAPNTDNSNILNIGNLIFGTNIDGTGETLSSGNIGIGTKLPYAKLSISNTGTTPGFIVEDSTSPDPTPFVISANGNVGIGEKAPQSILHLQGTFPKIIFENTGAGNGNYINADSNGLIVAGSIFRVNTAGVERLRIKSSGNVGIGNIRPNSLLHLGKPQNTVDDYLQIDSEAGSPPSRDCTDGDATQAGRMIIDHINNRLYICNSLSDGRAWDYVGLTDYDE